MTKTAIAILIGIISQYSLIARADYVQGCEDPKYHQYIKKRFTYYQTKNRRLLDETQRDYQRSLSTSQNPYRVIADLARHLKYSAQFDPINLVKAKIDRIFEHADALSKEQQIAGDVFDRFSSETHSVGIARAWIAYRSGALEVAFEELLKSIEVSDSAILSSFGPDVEFIRHIYDEGHSEPVVAYIKKTKEFWTGRRADGLRYVWLKMIEAKCKVQFDSFDTITVLELGLSVMDVNKDYGLSR